MDVHSLALVNEFSSTHPGAPRHIRVADFDYIAFRSFPNCSAGSSLPKGGNVRELPLDFQFTDPWVQTSFLQTRGFPWTLCTGPHYFRLFYMGISVHGPAIYLNLLHMDLCIPIDPRAWIQIIFRFLSMDTQGQST